jgi:penicillin amidase
MDDTMKRWLLSAVIAMAAGSAAAQPASFEALAKASLSQHAGTLDLPGLREPVEVRRDESGVPHIYARNDHDLFFAQGFVIAQDRLWQLEMNRHVSQGRISELIGEAGLPHDRLVRTFRFRGALDDAEWTNYHPQAREILEAYADGINAFIRQAGDDLPVEFKLTGHRPQPWKAEEILVRARITAALSDARQELRLAQEVARDGAEAANRRAAPDPYGELAVPEGVDYSLIGDEVIAALDGHFVGDYPRPELLPQFKALALAALSLDPGSPELAPGSNNWAVAPARSKTGKAIMVDDPHRQVTLPAWRYVIHLNAPGWNVAGATEPGLPGVIRGHNGKVSWGRTATGTDEADVFIETLNPANPNEVLWNGRWEPLRTVTEVIKVKGRQPELMDVKISRHGPIFYVDARNNLAYALKSSLNEQGTAEYIGALRLNQGDSAADCLNFGKFIKSPPTNLVCADSGGNIAFQVTAAAPNRMGWNGRIPVPGTGKYEWAGLREDLPREYNPARNYIATANNNIHPKGWATPLFYDKQPPYYRVERISKLIEDGGKFAPTDFIAVLRDNYRAEAEAYQPLFSGWRAADPTVEAARAALVRWDRYMKRESAAAAVFHAWLAETDKATLQAAAAEEKPRLAEAALERAVTKLKGAQGADPAKWRYGQSHYSTFNHPLARAYDLPRAERDGGFNTVNSTGAVYRLITDFSNLDKSVFTLGPGQSGQPGSPHYGDLLDRWNGGGFFPLHYSREAVVKNTRDTLVLQPAGGRSTGLMRSGAGPTDLPAYNEGVQERQPTP